jgi:uncharacterized protein (DUF1810 family)
VFIAVHVSTIVTWKALRTRVNFVSLKAAVLRAHRHGFGFVDSTIKPNWGQPVTEADLLPFVNAQAPVYSQVIEELTAGCKQTHWLWFIFPQVKGLGHSAMAQRYAIRDLDQATRYLADPILGSRLRHDVRLMMGHKGKSALEILGSPDDLKFRSCLNPVWSSSLR